MMRAVFILAAAAAFATGQINAQTAAPAQDYSEAYPLATKQKSFLVTWVDVVPGVRVDGTLTATTGRLKGFESGDVVISGPGSDGKHVWYATLKDPTDKELESAIKSARLAWEADRKVSLTASPKSPRNADGSLLLPVGTFNALDELNAKRAREGLKPFIYDEGLTIAAANAALIRSKRLLFGHLDGQLGDFSCLPQGCKADAAGCAAYPESYGWMSCCMNPQTGDDGYRFAGAAYAIGTDGKRYMHLFVRY